MKRLDIFLLLVIHRLHPKTLFIFIVKIFDIADKFILPVGIQNLKWITSFLIDSSLTPFLAIKALREGCLVFLREIIIKGSQQYDRVSKKRGVTFLKIKLLYSHLKLVDIK